MPLIRAHAHNDYEHSRPLFDALDRGFCSLEADIWLVDGQLLVAHDRDKVVAGRTLEALYLNPLQQRSRQNGGRIFLRGPTVILLIDIKSEAEPTYHALNRVLSQYADMLTQFSSGGIKTNAVMAIVSGNRPRPVLAEQTHRFAAMDGRLPDLESSTTTTLIPLISDDWKRVFKWRGIGPFPSSEREFLKTTVNKAHSQGRLIRFWGTPDQPEVWNELFVSGVDLINTDNLPGLQQFLEKQLSQSEKGK